MTTFAIQHATEIIDGPSYKVHANHLIDNFNGIISNFGDVLNITTSSAQTITGACTWNAAQTFKAACTGIFPYKYRNNAAPVWSSSTQYTVAYLACRDSTNAIDIIKTSSTTVDVTTTGLNGITKSAALTGTTSTTNGSATITGSSTTFQTDYQVGDIYTDTNYSSRITAIASNTSMTVLDNATATTSGMTYYRGGGKAKQTWYYQYAITNANNATPGVILSTRNLAGGDSFGTGDLPSGYSYSQQDSFACYTDTSNNLLPFYIGDGWPMRPSIWYRDATNNASPYYIVNNQAVATFTGYVLTTVALAPKNIVGAYITANGNTNASYVIYARPTGGTGQIQLAQYVSGMASIFSTPTYVPCNSSYSIDLGGGGNNITANIYGIVMAVA